jgi:multimeric flavodoxin WrbA
MKAVIFNGAKEDDKIIDAIERALTDQLGKFGWEVEPLELRSMQIAECVSCFGCWVKTPGTCVINDDGQETTRKAIQSDLLVWLTPVTFGGYSSELKKALDRIIPLVMPYFESYRGQVHHTMRYKKYPKLLVIGVQETGVEYEETFLALAGRNKLNFRPLAFAAGVFRREKNPETIPAFVEGQLRKVEVIS